MEYLGLHAMLTVDESTLTDELYDDEEDTFSYTEKVIDRMAFLSRFSNLYEN